MGRIKQVTQADLPLLGLCLVVVLFGSRQVCVYIYFHPMQVPILIAETILEHTLAGYLTMEVVFKVVIWNIIIDQHPLIASYAIPYQRHKVAVVDSANDLNLCLEFTLSLSTS